jgi:hypothetical protein
MEAPIKRSPQQQQQQQTSSASATASSQFVGPPTLYQQQQLPSITTTTPLNTDVGQKSAILEQFATLLGTANHHRTKELVGLFSTSVTDDQVVLIVPSLDLQFTSEGGEQHGIKDLLPQMGTHSSIVTTSPLSSSTSTLSSSGLIHANETTTSSFPTGQQPQPRPNMAASVLNRNTTTSTFFNREQRQQQQQCQDSHLNQDTVDASFIQSAAQHIGKQTSWTKSSLPYATNAVGTNVNDSFRTLFNSRLRAWTLILLRHSLSTGSTDSRTKLLGMLGAKIDITSHEFAYRTLPLPEAAKNAKPIDADIILPLLFDVSLNITIQDKQEKITVRAPGTISGTALLQ